MVLSFICCMKRNGNEVCALDANKLRRKIFENGFGMDVIAHVAEIDTALLIKMFFGHGIVTISDAIKLKEILALTNAEAIDIFLS